MKRNLVRQTTAALLGLASALLPALGMTEEPPPAGSPGVEAAPEPAAIGGATEVTDADATAGSSDVAVGEAVGVEAVDAEAVAPPSADADAGRGEATRQRARNATVVIRSFTPVVTLESAVSKVEELGGYVQSSQTGEAQLKVPMPALDTTILALRDLGEVVDERVESEDVTLEIITIAARIQELESSRGRVRGMLALASGVGESLSIEKELQQVTDELERNEGRLRYLQSRTQEAPLTLQVSMKARPQVERPSKRRPFDWVGEYGPSRLLR